MVEPKTRTAAVLKAFPLAPEGSRQSQDANLPSQDSILADLDTYRKSSNHSADSPSRDKKDQSAATQHREEETDLSALMMIRIPGAKPSESAMFSGSKKKDATTIDYGSGIIAPGYVQIAKKPGTRNGANLGALKLRSSHIRASTTLANYATPSHKNPLDPVGHQPQGNSVMQKNFQSINSTKRATRNNKGAFVTNMDSSVGPSTL